MKILALLNYMSSVLCIELFNNMLKKMFKSDYETLVKISEDDNSSFIVSRLNIAPGNDKPIITDDPLEEIFTFKNNEQLAKFYELKMTNLNELIKDIANEMQNKNIEQLKIKITEFLKDFIVLKSLIYDKRDWLFSICHANIKYESSDAIRF